ncbi:hypothetical protein HOI26_02715 [Candidatus Woesearchaeota archaeon]|nr:hypothetical protein [Candidatus Woesearchaeota archaeon]
MVSEFIAVHRSRNRKTYERAEEEKILLFYSTTPHCPGINLRIRDFAGEYLVHPGQAMQLYDLVVNGEEPQNIVDILRLESVSESRIKSF